MSETKTCPWCGGAPKTYRYQPGVWFVECETESCLVQPLTDPCDTQDAAIAAWNKRSPDALAGQLYEALRDLVKGISTCHYCGAELISEHGASHCEDCPSGCEAHDAPDCPQTADLIEAATAALRAYEERAK